jgi:hypothetical protein
MWRCTSALWTRLAARFSRHCAHLRRFHSDSFSKSPHTSPFGFARGTERNCSFCSKKNSYLSLPDLAPGIRLQKVGEGSPWNGAREAIHRERKPSP